MCLIVMRTEGQCHTGLRFCISGFYTQLILVIRVGRSSFCQLSGPLQVHVLQQRMSNTRAVPEHNLIIMFCKSAHSISVKPFNMWMYSAGFVLFEREFWSHLLKLCHCDETEGVSPPSGCKKKRKAEMYLHNTAIKEIKLLVQQICQVLTQQ